MAMTIKGAAVAAALSGAIALGGASFAETLQDALALAYGSNPTLEAERARLRAIDESFVQARAGGLPSLSASVDVSGADSFSRRSLSSFGQPTTITTDDTSADATTSLSASQTLYRGGQVRAGVASAKASIEAGRANLLSVEQSVLFSVVGFYTQVRRDEAVVGIRANNVEVLARQLQAAQDRFEVGEITKTDVAQAEARLAAAKSQLAAAKAALVASRAGYERVVGQPPGTLDPEPPLPELPASFDAALEEAFDQNPSVRAARFNADAARADVRAAKGTLLPTVSLSASAQRTDGLLTGGSDLDSVGLGVRLTAPLYAGGANSSRLRQARENEAGGRLAVYSAEREARESVSSSWSGYDSALSQTNSTREQVRAAEIALKGVEEEARVGLRTTLDVLNAEQELLDARLALVTAERDVYVAGFALLQSVGRLTADELKLSVDKYDPAVNLSSIRRKYLGIGLLEPR